MISGKTLMYPKKSTSSQHHHPVSPSLSKGKDLEQMTNEIVSQEYSERSLNSDLNSSASKTLPDSSVAHTAKAIKGTPISKISCSTFPGAGTMHNGYVLEAVLSITVL